MLKELIESVVTKLVDNPGEVAVDAIETEQTITIELRVAPGDLGKVIGKEGRTARSLRTLLHAVASKGSKRAVLEIIE